MSNTTIIGPTGGEGVAVNETNRLISSDKVEGTPVYNHAGESLGSIYTLMINKYSGLVSYAVMSFGGFLGVGERYHPLPWKALTYDTDLGGYVVDVSREQLEGAPSYAPSETPWSDPAYGRSVSDYYGLSYGGAPWPRHPVAIWSGWSCTRARTGHSATRAARAAPCQLVRKEHY